MSRISISLNFTGRLFRAFVPGMPTLFYFWTRRGVFCWNWKDGWIITHWQRFKDLRYYFENEQKGNVRLSNKLEFLVETGKSLEETFEDVGLTTIMEDYQKVVAAYNELVRGKNE